MVHGIVTDGGQGHQRHSPAGPRVRYSMRAVDSESLHELDGQDRPACFAAGSVATGCTHTVTETAARLCRVGA